MAFTNARILGPIAAMTAVLALAAAVAWRTPPHPVASSVAPPTPASNTNIEIISTPPAESPKGEPSTGSAPTENIPKRCPAEPPLEIPRIELPQSTEELFRIAQEKPESLGPASIGSPTRGSLFGGIELKNSDGIQHSGGYAWGTEVVIRSIERAVKEVRRCFPNTPILHVGDISRERGGWLRPHRSHQSGLDADIGYYYKTPATWYLRATAQNLDVPRTWMLIRSLIEGGQVEMIFIDLSIQRLLKAYITTLPENEQAGEELFQSPSKKDTIIRHTWGHATHFHVRFSDRSAVALGEKLGPMMGRLLAARKAAKRAPPRRLQAAPPKG